MNQEIQEQNEVSMLVKRVFEFSNLTPQQIADVLHGSDELTPCNAPVLNQIKERLELAKQRNEKVMIVGDYDCDGMCATAILKDTLDRLGIVNGFYIPHRFNEGYGINTSIVKQAYDKGYTLIITVDNGVNAKEAIDLCNELGLEIIVTDHHQRQEDLAWSMLLHPTVLEDQFELMCGASMALLISRTCLNEIKEHVILACIATIGDMMPVFKENRSLIKRGVRFLNERKFMAIESLLDRQCLKWDEKEISFNIVPKLNAIGRMADEVNPNNVVYYLLDKRLSIIESGAKQIKAINQKRRKLSKSYSDLAFSMLQVEDDFHIVVDDDFHEGLIGLVASSITAKTKKPSIVFCKKNDQYKGSARSVKGINLFEFFDEFNGCISEFGGHNLAAGIHVPVEKMEAFKELVQQRSKLFKPSHDGSDFLKIESAWCNIESLNELEKCRPFGQGFEMPNFEICEFKLVSSQILKDKYPKWILNNGTNELEAISFICDKLLVNENITSIIGTIGLNEFRGISKVSITVNDVKKV